MSQPRGLLFGLILFALGSLVGYDLGWRQGYRDGGGFVACAWQHVEARRPHPPLREALQDCAEIANSRKAWGEFAHETPAARQP